MFSCSVFFLFTVSRPMRFLVYRAERLLCAENIRRIFDPSDGCPSTILTMSNACKQQYVVRQLFWTIGLKLSALAAAGE